MKVQEYQRTEKLRPLNAPTRNFVEDKRGEILGAALRQVGSDLQSVAQQKMDEANTTKFIDFKTKMDQYAIETRKTFRERKGESAINCTPEYLEALDKRKDELMEDMNHKQSQMALQWYGAYRNGQEDTMLSHESAEVGKYNVDMATNNMAQSQARLVNALVGNNPKEAKEAAIDLENANRWYCTQTGKDFKTVQQASQSVVNLSLIKRRLEESPTSSALCTRMKATADIARKEGRMTETDYLKAIGMIEPYQKKAEVTGCVDKAFAETVRLETENNANKANAPKSLKYEVGYKIIDEGIKDPAMKQSALQLYDQRYKLRESAIAEEKANTIAEIQGELNKGVPLAQIVKYQGLSDYDKANINFFRNQDDPTTVVGWMTNPETLTVDSVNNASGLLTLKGREKYLKIAQEKDVSRKKAILGYSPSTSEISHVLRAIGKADLAKEGSENFSKVYLMVKDLVQSDMATKSFEMTPKLFRDYVGRAASMVHKNSGWSNSKAYELHAETITREATGQGDVTNHTKVSLSNFDGDVVLKKQEPVFHALVLNSLASDPQSKAAVSADALNSRYKTNCYLVGPNGMFLQHSNEISSYLLKRILERKPKLTLDKMSDVQEIVRYIEEKAKDKEMLDFVMSKINTK